MIYCIIVTTTELELLYFFVIAYFVHKGVLRWLGCSWKGYYVLLCTERNCWNSEKCLIGIPGEYVISFANTLSCIKTINQQSFHCCDIFVTIHVFSGTPGFARTKRTSGTFGTSCKSPPSCLFISISYMMQIYCFTLSRTRQRELFAFSLTSRCICA